MNLTNNEWINALSINDKAKLLEPLYGEISNIVDDNMCCGCNECSGDDCYCDKIRPVNIITRWLQSDAI